MFQRMFLLTLGHISFILGLIFFFVPFVPTTPLIIFAGGCYKQSSEWFHQLLLNNRLVGPSLQNWEKTGSISLRAKCTAIGMMIIAITYSVISAPLLPVKIGLVITAVCVSWFIISRPLPTKDRQPHAAESQG